MIFFEHFFGPSISWKFWWFRFFPVFLPKKSRISCFFVKTIWQHCSEWVGAGKKRSNRFFYHHHLYFSRDKLPLIFGFCLRITHFLSSHDNNAKKPVIQMSFLGFCTWKSIFFHKKRRLIFIRSICKKNLSWVLVE